MSLGVRYYLTKPLEELDLQQCVRQIIMDIERARGSEADIISEIIDAAQRTRSNSKDTPLSNGEFQKEYLP
jgi:YesN/AraC family two-component response regulator